MKDFTLLNSLGRQDVALEPLEEGKIKVYVCGITPYDYAHIGHGRCYVTFDVLVRFLRFLGYEVSYVRNFTDIDDKLIRRAEEAGGDTTYLSIAEKFEAAYHEDMDALGCLRPEVEPKVTEHIPQIIEFIEGLIEKGHAYAVDGDVYFDVTTSSEYGKLSGRKLEDMLAGARVEVNTKKKNPADFALWKGNADGEFWSSPWGHGRPGWHIECSVLARTYLGDEIDIHGGGMDLTFPHHENEIAQTEGLTGKPFSRYWMHNAFVNINKEKMSKSLGNFFTLKDVFKKFDPMVLRYYFLQHQYRTPIDFSFEGLEAACKAYKKLTVLFEKVSPVSVSEDDMPPLVARLSAALSDDLNTPKMIGILFEYSDEIKSDPAVAGPAKWFVQNVAGLSLIPLTLEVALITPAIQKLIDDRLAARFAKDWARADEIRDQLEEMGVELQDEKL